MKYWIKTQIRVIKYNIAAFSSFHIMRVSFCYGSIKVETGLIQIDPAER